MAGSDVTYDLGLSTTVNRLEILTRASETKIVVLPLRQNEVRIKRNHFFSSSISLRSCSCKAMVDVAITTG